MPSFHFWAGNPSFVEKVLRYFFGYDFRIVENVESEYGIPDDIRSRLGSSSSALGEGFVVGRSFKERDSSYELQVLGVAPDEVRDLLPGKPKRRKLEWVLSTCMPNNLDCQITVKVDRSRLVLGQKGCLGYSTFV
jgi:predicted component of type VI protein secretion system